VFLISVGIVIKKHVLQALVHERENQQYNTQNNEGHNLTHGWHLPQVVDDEFANYERKGHEADDAQVLAMHAHSGNHLRHTSSSERERQASAEVIATVAAGQ